MASLLAAKMKLVLNPLLNMAATSVNQRGSPGNQNFACKAGNLDVKLCKWVMQPACHSGQGSKPKQNKQGMGATLSLALRSCCKRKWEWAMLVSMQMAVVSSIRKDTKKRSAVLAMFKPSDSTAVLTFCKSLIICTPHNALTHGDHPMQPQVQEDFYVLLLTF
jgi:hypothetical protein